MSAVTKLVAKDANHATSDARFVYSQCNSCDIVSIDRIPDKLDLCYPSEYLSLLSAQRLEEIARRDVARLDVLLRFKREGRLLEVGPGAGVMLRQAISAGFDVEAIEVDSDSSRHLSAILGVPVHVSAAPEEVIGKLPSSDVVVLWQVLEHLPRPWAVLRAAASNLAQDGVLIVATPNPSAFQFRVLRSRWPHLDAPRHLQLIPPQLLIDRLHSDDMAVVSLTSDDPSARAWNRFGWRRALANAHPGIAGQVLAYTLGSLLAAAASPLESSDFNGSTYTAVFKKGRA